MFQTPQWPIWDQDDLAAVTEVVQSGKWWCGAPLNQVGKNLWAFQEEFAQFQEVKHCIAVANGTVAIEVVLLALGIGLGDEVIVPDYTFVASASAVIAANAVPIFCDIDRDTFVLDANKAETLITPRTKAIIAVHLGGNPVDMKRLGEIAEKHHISLIEDCAHAHGSRYHGKRAGNWSAAGTFSFQASKTLTAGEGGAIICNDDALADALYSISDCGRKKGEYFYAHFQYGTNYRLSEFHAALLRKQLQHFPQQHALRNTRAKYLTEHLNAIEGIRVMQPTPGTEELGYYIYPFVYDPACFGQISNAEFKNRLHQAGIPTADCYPPLHTLVCFKNRQLRKGIDYSSANWGGTKSEDQYFPVVTEVYGRSIQFPQNLLLAEQSQLDQVVDVIQYLRSKERGC
ncbi:glutamine--scyllo-inositol transaminase [Candidatus Vecturithrix granuli]|uniref:Glutamine--scyllo-inositol transaminase n=1 Tax=Vecturithrix granuli TaxID=1499967 RepID=A0A081C1B8_VECG1|nr:glutamine--scyllo-inositol transaminase [Candidatus Vecturithrix granuli]